MLLSVDVFSFLYLVPKIDLCLLQHRLYDDLTAKAFQLFDQFFP
jgi:hypothetical protein